MTETSSGTKKLIMYGRDECHLCAEMISSLKTLQKETPFLLEIIDIDKDKNLVERYNDRVPVLVAAAEGRELCHYFLDVEAVNTYLS